MFCQGVTNEMPSSFQDAMRDLRVAMQNDSEDLKAGRISVKEAKARLANHQMQLRELQRTLRLIKREPPN